METARNRVAASVEATAMIFGCFDKGNSERERLLGDVSYPYSYHTAVTVVVSPTPISSGIASNVPKGAGVGVAVF